MNFSVSVEIGLALVFSGSLVNLPVKKSPKDLSLAGYLHRLAIGVVGDFYGFFSFDE
jgi:hypothetical protein